MWLKNDSFFLKNSLKDVTKNNSCEKNQDFEAKNTSNLQNNISSNINKVFSFKRGLDPERKYYQQIKEKDSISNLLRKQVATKSHKFKAGFLEQSYNLKTKKTGKFEMNIQKAKQLMSKNF